MRERIKYIDIVAGIMIFWMIVQHAIQSAWEIDPNVALYNPNVWFPYLNFFMPWFFYKSGVFFQKRRVKDLWIKDYGKLLRTFIVWSLVGYVVYLLLGWYDHTLTLHEAIRIPTKRFFFWGHIEMNGPLWFLLTLVGVRFLANIVLTSIRGKYLNTKCVLIIIVASILAYIANLYNNPLMPRWVGNGASGLAFFTMGYWLRDYEKKLWMIVPATLVYVGSCIFGWNSVCMNNNGVLEGHYLLWFPSALCGIVLFNNAFRAMSEWVSKITPPSIRAAVCSKRLANMPCQYT